MNCHNAGWAGVRRKKPSAIHSNDLLLIAFITVISMFTMSSNAVQVAGIPRITIVAMLGGGIILILLRCRIHVAFVAFSLAYVVGFLPGSVEPFLDGDIYWLSVIQMLLSLFCFATLGTYFYLWMQNTDDRTKEKVFFRTLLAFLVFSIVEIAFYEQFSSIRYTIYRTSFSDFYASILTDRELRIYGGRPTFMFSETSHFARLVGLYVAAYMVASRCSMMSLLALLVSITLLRSASIFFALPVMALALLQTPPSFSKLKSKPKIRITNIVIAGTIALIVGTAIFISQMDRLKQASEAGGDGSLSARLIYPLMFLVSDENNLFIGNGLTPQDDIQNFTEQKQFDELRIQRFGEYKEGIAATAVIISGMGIIGMVIFYLVMAGYLGPARSAVIFVSCLFANSISSGYNSPSQFVPSALLIALLLYQMTKRRRPETSSPPAARSTEHPRDRLEGRRQLSTERPMWP